MRSIFLFSAGFALLLDQTTAAAMWLMFAAFSK